jgi:hypothetical protein
VLPFQPALKMLMRNHLVSTFGYRADLVLSADNPLEKMETLRAPLGVMANGVWRDADELGRIRHDIRGAYQRASTPPPSTEAALRGQSRIRSVSRNSRDSPG